MKNLAWGSKLLGKLAGKLKHAKYDIYYVENWSLTFDLKILLMTLFGRKTYRSVY